MAIVNTFMKLMRILFLMSLLVLTGNKVVWGQGPLAGSDLRNVEVEKLSDEEIRVYYQKASESGLSDDQLIELAKARGLGEKQVALLKQRIAALNLSGSKQSSSSAAGSSTETVNVTESIRKFDEKLGMVPMETTPVNRRIFGAELFSRTSTTFEPNLRIATPMNYIIGPDDELIINVYGYSEKTYREKVNAEGNIYIENVGPIYVAGLTFEEAEAKVRSKLAGTIYKAMNSGATRMQMRLGNIRSIRITIIGEAKKPGTYTVSSLTTVFNALYLCGGPTDLGSYRNIELIRNNVIIKKIDLYKFLQSGDRSDNLLLQEQDVIRIPYYEKRMVLVGQVKRPGVFELTNAESFEQILNYAGRFTDSAYKKSVTVYTIDDTRLRVKDLMINEFATYKPNNGDSIVVGTVPFRFANRVRISGAVMRPGDYELTADMSLQDLIEKAGGVREDVFKGSGSILRLADNLSLENVSFDLEKVLSGKEKIALKREDEVILSSLFDLQDQYVVNIDGEVHKSGTFTWRKDITVRDLILQAGGITEAGTASNKVLIEISRRIRNADVSGKNFKQSEIIRLQINKDLSGAEAATPLEPFDIVVLRPHPGYQMQRSVNISGPVMFPGRYFLEKSGERISDLVRRAGGFQAIADSNSVFIRRFKSDGIDMDQRLELISKLTNISADSIAKSPNLQQELAKAYTSLSVNLNKALSNPGSNDDLILENGDLIMVSQSSSLVKVSGEVYFPTMIPYEPGTNLKYYVKRTGNYTSKARRNQAFVIYPDGKAKAVKKFLWFKSYPKVTPRSEVFVPSKGEKIKQGLSTGEWVAISSIIATLGTLVVTVINNR